MKEPALHGDFCIVPVDERIAWRDGLARHLINQVAPADLPGWKRSESVGPMRATIAVLLDEGVRQISDFVDRLKGNEPAGHRNDYAASE